MKQTPAIAIFDIGKTNKKMFVFDPQYRVLLEKSIQLGETTDEVEMHVKMWRRLHNG